MNIFYHYNLYSSQVIDIILMDKLEQLAGEIAQDFFRFKDRKKCILVYGADEVIRADFKDCLQTRLHEKGFEFFVIDSQEEIKDDEAYRVDLRYFLNHQQAGRS